MSTAPRTDLELTGAGGQRISARRYGATEGPAVVLAHGILCHQDLPEIVALAERLATNFAVITLDFRGHGSSGGTFSLGRHEYRDLALVIEHLHQRHPKVGVVGFSFGGFHAVLAATLVRIDALCLVSAPAHLRLADSLLLGRAYFRTLPRILKRHRQRVRVNPLRFPRLVPRDAISGLDVPVLIIHGTDDWIVSQRHAQLLYDRARGVKRLDIIPGGLHAEYLLEQDPGGMAARISAWLQQFL